MAEPPRLTDRTALAARRTRMRGDAAFLLTRVAGEIEERLAEVNRKFPRIAVVGGPWWAGRVPGAVLVPDDPVLDFGPQPFDLVIHAMALHWADDPVGQIIQCRRALRPDGLFLAACFGGQTLHELRGALAQAESELTGGLSPRVAPMAEIRDLGGLLQRAGLALPVADSDVVEVTYPSILALGRDLRGMGEANAMQARHRHPATRALFDRAEVHYRAHHPAGDDRLRATFEVLWLTGWAPSDDQPRALRPGSAQTRLADALGTTEVNPRNMEAFDDRD